MIPGAKDERVAVGRGVEWRPQVPANAVMLLAGIRREQRRLTWLVESLNRPEVPERVLMLLDDSLLGLREAAAHLEHVMTYEPPACPNPCCAEVKA